MSHCLVVDGESTSTYLAVLDHLGDMSVAINDMGILNRLTQEHLQQVLDQIQEDDILMIDTNLDVSLIEWMMKETKGRIFVDPISCGKATKLKGLLSYIDVFKPNVFEAEYLTGIPYENEESVDQMGQFFLDQGIKEVFISLGSKGVRAYSKDKTVSIQCEAIEVVNATGAGDAFMGAITAATLMGYSLIDKLKFAQASAICTLMSHDSVCRELSVELVNEQMKKYTFNIEEE